MNFSSSRFFSFCVDCPSTLCLPPPPSTQYIPSIFFLSSYLCSFFFVLRTTLCLSLSLPLFLCTYHDLFDAIDIVDFIEIIFRIRMMLVFPLPIFMSKIVFHSGMYVCVCIIRWLKIVPCRDTLVSVNDE